jgi:hypothetical protein
MVHGFSYLALGRGFPVPGGGPPLTNEKMLDSLLPLMLGHLPAR